MIRTHLLGPRDPKTGGEYRCDLTLHLQRLADTLFVYASDAAEVLHVRTGEWSDWLKVKFKTGLLQATRGMVRFYLLRTEPTLELYASPINFDPDAALSHQFAARIRPRIGPRTRHVLHDRHGRRSQRFE